MSFDPYEVAVLAEDYSNKRMRLEALAAANTYGLSPEERQKLDIRYELADAEVFQAWRKLQAAKTRI